MEVYSNRGHPLAPFLDKYLRVLVPFKHLLQATTTKYAPKWVLRNVARDFADSFMQAPGVFPTGRDWLPALRAVAGKSPEFRALTWQGALQAGREATTMDPGAAGDLPGLRGLAPAIVDRLGPAGPAAQRAGEVLWQFMSAPFNWLEYVGQTGERLTRTTAGLAERRAALARGLPPEEAVAIGAKWSRISTQPYMRKGRLIGFLNRYKAFLNAQFQGIYNPLKTMRQRPVETLIKGAMYTALTTMLYAINRDNPDWQNLPSWRKYCTFNVPIGEDEKGETRFAWLPVPWMWHYYFGAPAIATAEYARKNDPQIWRDFVAQMWSANSPTGEGVEIHPGRTAWEVGSQVAGSVTRTAVPDALSPLWALERNRTWTGREIVPYFERHLAPEKQVADWSSETARIVGRRFPGGGMSPRQVDHLLESYGGTVARDVSEMVDRIAAAQGWGEKPESPADQSWLERGMVGTASRSGGMRERFYQEMGRLERLRSRWGDGEEIPDTVHADLDRYEHARWVRNALARISREKREVVAGEDSREEKQRLLDRLTAEETLLLAEFLGRPAPEWAQEMAGRRR